MGKLKTTTPVNRLSARIEAGSRADSWVNVVNGLGTADRDRTQAARFVGRGTGNGMTAVYETLFAEDPIAYRIAELPAREMLRQGFRIDLDGGGDQQADIMAAWDNLSASALLIEAMTLARALGGAAVFIGADDDQQLDAPLELARLRSVRYLKVLTRQELTAVEYYVDINDDKFGEPAIYEINMQAMGGSVASSQTLRVHETRLLKFDGTTTTPSRRRQNGGWGESVFVRTENNLSLMAQAVAGLSNALSDGDQAIFKLDGLLDILRGGSEGDAAIRARLSQALSTSRGLLVAMTAASMRSCLCCLLRPASLSLCFLADLLRVLIPQASLISNFFTTP
jgi:phage-related protein (TIGR01555 family)